MQRIGREGNQAAAGARRAQGCRTGMNLKVATLIVRVIAELQREGELAVRAVADQVDMPVEMTAFRAMIDGVLELVGKTGNVEAIDLGIEGPDHPLQPLIDPGGFGGAG